MAPPTKTGRITRSGRGDQRPVVGFLLHSLEDDYGVALWAGAVDAARAMDASLITFLGRALGSLQGFDAQANVLYDLVSAQSVDGVIFSSGSLSMYSGIQGLTDFCQRYRPLPMVSLAAPLEGIPSVLVENYQGIHAMMAHVIEVHRARRIAFISGPTQVLEAEMRYRAYVDALTEYDLPLDSALVSPPTTWTEATGRQAICTLLDERGLQPGAGFDAVVASDDETALGALIELQARGFYVPDDVLVTGFDGLERGTYFTPALTSVRQPVYEQARRAIACVLAQLRGEEVPVEEYLPSDLLLRQSCGCPDPAVLLAAATPAASTAAPARAGGGLAAALAARREVISAEMVRAAGASSERLAPAWVEQLLEAFSNDVEEKASGSFLPALDRVVRQVVSTNGDIKAWQGVLSALRRQVLPDLTETGLLHRAEDLWQQARVMIAETTYRARAYQELLARQQAERLRQIGQTLIMTFDLTPSIEALTRGLSELGIPACYLSLYEDPAQPERGSILLLAYNEDGPVDLPPGGLHFPSHELVPQYLLPARRSFSAVVVPLYFQEQQLGLAFFEVGPRDGAIYESLRGQISSLLQGTLLMQQVQQHAGQLDAVVAETLATAEQMRLTITEVAQQARTVADTARQSMEVSKTGEDAVARTVAGMEVVRQQVEEIAASILALSAHTQQIGEIISAVDDIADQSKLLSLNASIEAARAGDQGRTFAVVAREMRLLAGQSREATTKVSDILNRIQQAADTAVMVTEEGSKGAQSGMELANRAGGAIRDLAATIEEAAHVAVQIAASTHQQSSAMDQLVAAIQSAKKASSQATINIREAGLAAKK